MAKGKLTLTIEFDGDENDDDVVITPEFNFDFTDITAYFAGKLHGIALGIATLSIRQSQVGNLPQNRAEFAAGVAAGLEQSAAAELDESKNVTVEKPRRNL